MFCPGVINQMFVLFPLWLKPCEVETVCILNHYAWLNAGLTSSPSSAQPSHIVVLTNSLCCLSTSTWCNIGPHCRQHITASNNHIQLPPNHFILCDCCVAAVQILKESSEKRRALLFIQFPTTHNEFRLKSHKWAHTHTHTPSHADTHLGDSDNVLWWYQIGAYGRQIQLAMLVHSTKPFVLQTHISMLRHKNKNARPQIPTCAWRFT